MPPQNKRHRLEENENKMAYQWARIFTKIMALLEPLGMFLATRPQEDDDPRQILPVVQRMSIRDLVDVRWAVETELSKRQNENPEAGATSSGSATPSTTTTRPQDTIAADFFSAAQKIGDVPGMELVFGLPPKCRCNLPMKLHMCRKHGENYNRCCRPGGAP